MSARKTIIKEVNRRIVRRYLNADRLNSKYHGLNASAFMVTRAYPLEKGDCGMPSGLGIIFGRPLRNLGELFARLADEIDET